MQARVAQGFGTIALIAGMLAAGAATAGPAKPTGDPAKAEENTVVAYKGKMVDEAGKPVSGIFPMTFKLYAGISAKKSLWADTMWVAVDRGIYTVRIGDHKAIPAREDLSNLVLGIEIRGLGQVVREPFVASKASVATSASQGPAGGTVVQAPANGANAAALNAAKGQSGSKYADAAGYAVEADHAKTADRLQNYTLEDLVRKIAEDSGGGGPAKAGKVKIGMDRRFGNRVGGPGGTGEYNEACPKGYVMVGAKGGAGIYLDSIQIICAPLE